MHRKHLNYIKDWATRRNRKPLIIRGARQVGKTTLVRLACKELALELVEVNMEYPQEFTALLHLNNPKKVFESIALSMKLSHINPSKQLFFFDEAQNCKALIPFLRYCHERAPEFNIIVTGSLLEFTLEADNYSFPVGRIEFLYLGPMTFEEFLGGTGNQLALEKLQNVSLTEPFDEATHLIFLKHLKDYLIIGGMPEAINAYRETQSQLEVERIKQSILATYQADFHKYSRKADIHLLNRILATIPNHLGKKVMYSKLSEGSRSEAIKRCIELLELSKIVQRCYHSHADAPPLNAQQKANHFKLIFLDVGLIQSMLGVSFTAIETTAEINGLAKGILAEQFVGQHLMYSQPPFIAPALHYWERQTKGSIAEVDYLLSINQTIFPVEVKSAHKGHMRSLQQFVIEKNVSKALRFSSGNLLKGDYQTSNETPYQFLNIPHYLIEQCERLVNHSFFG